MIIEVCFGFINDKSASVDILHKKGRASPIHVLKPIRRRVEIAPGRKLVICEYSLEPGTTVRFSATGFGLTPISKTYSIRSGYNSIFCEGYRDGKSVCGWIVGRYRQQFPPNTSKK